MEAAFLAFMMKSRLLGGEKSMKTMARLRARESAQGRQEESVLTFCINSTMV